MQLTLGVLVGFILGIAIAGGISHPKDWLMQIGGAIALYLLSRFYSYQLGYIVDQLAVQFYKHALAWAKGHHKQRDPRQCSDCEPIIKDLPY